MTLRLHLDLTTFSGQVEKRLTLVPGHTAVYQEHIVTGVDAPTSLGHHATLQFPERPGAGHFSTSATIHAQVLVEPMENPETGGYTLLKPGAIIKDLTRVPTITGGLADLSRYPARRGYTDLAIFCADPALPVAWSAVALPDEGYAWFSLRDPKVLASTLCWMSNNGRHYPPWNSRHQNVMGVEDITGFFHCGAAESVRPNVLSRRGIRTSLHPTTRQAAAHPLYHGRGGHPQNLRPGVRHRGRTRPRDPAGRRRHARHHRLGHRVPARTCGGLSQPSNSYKIMMRSHHYFANKWEFLALPPQVPC